MLRPKNYPGVSTTTGQGRPSLTVGMPIRRSFCRIQSISRFAINYATVRDDRSSPPMHSMFMELRIRVSALTLLSDDLKALASRYASKSKLSGCSGILPSNEHGM
jgi:hypothetical protein